MYYKTGYNSPYGAITLVSDGSNLVGSWLEGQKRFGSKILPKATIKENLEIFNKTKEWLSRYFNGQKPEISQLPLMPIGGEFRQEVWKILCQIPYGQVMSYKDIAKKIAKQRHKNTMSAQAVGGAVANNPISIIIPCHRVIGLNKSLVGFSAGIETKMKLLEFEGVDVSKLIIPSSL